MRSELPATAIIPTLNRPEGLRRTLAVVFEQESVPAEVVVVDQSAPGLVREEIESITRAFPNVRHITLESPSLTRARNVGLKHCSNDIVILLDDDVDVNPSTIAATVDLMTSEDVALVGGLNDLSKPSGARSLGGYLFGMRSFRKRRMGHVTRSMLGRYPNRLDAPVETEWAMGYYFAVRKHLVERWQLAWDERLTGYAYAEDLDFSLSYCWHANREGLHCLLSPSVSACHLASREWRTPSYKHSLMYVAHRDYLSGKHQRGLIGLVANHWSNFGMLLLRTVTRQSPMEFLRAEIACIRSRKAISRGNFGLIRGWPR